MKKILIFIFMFILTTSLFAKEEKPKVKLIFSVDQILSNGYLVNNDLDALKNIIDAVKPLKKYYEVYLLLDPMIKDKSKLYNSLDFMKENDQDFVLEVMSSDAQALSGHVPYLIDPYDNAHGMLISPEELNSIKKKYGKYFAGIRFMETFGADFSTRCAKNLELTEQWVVDYRTKFPIPEDDYLQAKNIELYMKFAKDNKMFAEWTDFHWFAFSDWDKAQIKNEEILSDAIKKYPDTVIVCYSNNEPLVLSVPKVDTFDDALKTVVNKGGTLGIGLSNQSWLRSNPMETSPEEMILWCESALKKGCALIQFEPWFYYFNLPIGKLDGFVTDYRKEPEYADGKAGMPRENFKIVSKWLMEYGASK